MQTAVPVKGEVLRNLDSAFPPFVPGVATKSVYERAGFDVNKGERSKKPKPSSSSRTGLRRGSNGSQDSSRPIRRQAPPHPISLVSSSVPSAPNTPQLPLSASSGTFQRPHSPLINSSMAHNTTAAMPKSHLVPHASSEVPVPDVSHPTTLQPIPQALTHELVVTPPTVRPGDRSSVQSNASSVYSVSHDPVAITPRTMSTNHTSINSIPRVNLFNDFVHTDPLRLTKLSSSGSASGVHLDALRAFSNTPPLALSHTRKPSNVAHLDFKPPSRASSVSSGVSQPPSLYSSNSSSSPTTPHETPIIPDNESVMFSQHHNRSGSGASGSSRSSSSSRGHIHQPSLAMTAEADELAPAEPLKPVMEHVPEPVPTLPLKASARRTCRGCGEIIRGKCVSAKDGTVSGKWHRQCFTCTSCKTGFETGEFYVLDDLPYCKSCYHHENNSVCHACGEGIEGDCVETSSGDDGDDVTMFASSIVRYHAACLTCADCGEPIRDEEYYSLDGQPMCQMHAFVGGDSKVEKRRTRLLVL